MLAIMYAWILMLVLGIVTGIDDKIGDKGLGSIEYDWLIPYRYVHGPRHSNRHVRSYQPLHYGNDTHEQSSAHNSDNLQSIYHKRSFIQTIGNNKKEVLGHVITVNNPTDTISILEPGGKGGCETHTLETIQKTAKHCLIAVNAGLFNTHNGACLGNVVSEGELRKDSGGIQNAHFGITRSGELFFGYIDEVTELEEEFTELVGGVIWLVRNGTSYVDEALKAECSNSQETGTLKQFVDVRSARTAVGHDKEGRVIIAHVDGQTGKRGINLYEFAALLIKLGAVNAINLDGGGSSTCIDHGKVINYPSDTCSEDSISYRKVSTALCVHAYLCSPSSDCSGRGECVDGQCVCRDTWQPPACDVVHCAANNCSHNGKCTPVGCLCYPGWHGEDCTESCEPGYFGINCAVKCECRHGGECRPQDGRCDCPHGYHGWHCEHECGYGYYGKDCGQTCYCENECDCHHVTGSCDIPTTSPASRMGECVANYLVEERNLVRDHPEQFRLWALTLSVIALVTSLSLILNISLIFIKCKSTHVPKSGPLKQNSQKQTYSTQLLLSSSSLSSHDESDVEEVISLTVDAFAD